MKQYAEGLKKAFEVAHLVGPVWLAVKHENSEVTTYVRLESESEAIRAERERLHKKVELTLGRQAPVVPTVLLQ